MLKDFGITGRHDLSRLLSLRLREIEQLQFTYRGSQYMIMYDTFG